MLFDEIAISDYGFGVFQVPTRYVNLDPIGYGSVGNVCSAHDLNTGEEVAIKRVKDVLNNNGLAQRTHREIKMLKKLRHENLITLKDVFYSPANDIYIVTDLLQIDLYQLLYNRRLQKKYIQSFMYQIMRGLKYLHSAGIAHRDLKPSNIVVNDNCDLKICDFGMARQQDPQMTALVSTLYYRAPEVELTQGLYGIEIDIWSAGCVFSEMLEGKILLESENSKSNYHTDDGQHHLKLIMDLLGDIPEELMARITNKNVLRYLSGLPKRYPTPFRDHFETKDESALVLLEKMLKFNPESRVTAEEALEFEYLSPYREPELEVTAATRFYDEYSDARADYEPWMELIHAEIDDFRRSRGFEPIRQSTKRATQPGKISYGSAFDHTCNC